VREKVRELDAMDPLGARSIAQVSAVRRSRLDDDDPEWISRSSTLRVT